MIAERSQETEPTPREAGSFRSLSKLRKWFLGLSVFSVIICAVGSVLHYLKWAWGNPGQLVGWLLSMLFLLAAFAPRPGEVVRRAKTVFTWKTVFFAFWFLVFTISHLWNFRTAPWNGDALFDESGWDLFFLKHYVIGHPFQAAWFHSPLSRETLFHYYVWGFFGLFGYNILSYEAALFGIWCATFLFTLLLVDLLFDSRIVTTITALIFNFLPFSFMYTFAGYRYPMGTALCVISLYFLHLGFPPSREATARQAPPSGATPRSSFFLALGGIVAGLCWASSITGKQYLFILFVVGVIYAVFHWREAKTNAGWPTLIIIYGCLAAAMPLICYIAFTFEHYALYERSLIRVFWESAPGTRARGLWDLFFEVPGLRFFIPDTVPIPVPYFWFLLPGLVLAVWKKRFEIVLLAIIPVIGTLVAGPWENRLLLAIPFWMILMAFSFAGLLQVKAPLGWKIGLWGIAAFVASAGFFPSVRYIYNHTRDPFLMPKFAQEEVAVSRFLKQMVAGVRPVNPPRLERNEFNRILGVPAPSYDTFVCQHRAFSILHLFLHDYDDEKVMSFCAGIGFEFQSPQQVWAANKNAIANYSATDKDLKLVWERDAKTDNIIRMFEPLRDIGREESYTLVFGGKGRLFYVLTFQSRNITQLKERVEALPDLVQ